MFMRFAVFLAFVMVMPIAHASALDELSRYIMTMQRDFHRELVGLVRGLAKDDNLMLLWSLVSVSFLYGIFHAAGPGHGKAVIASYMLANRAPLRRGISLSMLSAFAQGVVAIVLVAILAQVFSLAGKVTEISRFFEIASFAAIGFIGVWMAWRLLRGKSSCGHDHSHDHDHDHDHDHVCCEHHHHEHHHHEHQHVEKQTTKRSLWAIVTAVGIRPCTGAILVLLFSSSAGIFIWGVLATLAMSLGTGITVAVLAALSVVIRDRSLALRRGKWQQRLQTLFGFIAAGALIFISVSMISYELQTAGRAF